MELNFYFREKREEEYETLLGINTLLPELKKAGINWRYGKDNLTGTEQAYALVTDDPQLALEMEKRGVCCIGYQDSSDPTYFPGAEAVITSFEELLPSFFLQICYHFYGIPLVIARTERLVIRESTMEDFPELYRISREEGNDRYTETMCGEWDVEREKFQAYIRQVYAYYGFGLWTVLEKETGKIVGRCGLFLPSSERKEATVWTKGTSSNTEEIHGTQHGMEMGYLIGKAYRRRGYAFEMCSAVLEYAAENFEDMPIYVRIHRENAASRKLAEKLGFRQVHSDFREEILFVFC